MMDVKGVGHGERGKVRGIRVTPCSVRGEKKEEEREERKIHLDRNFARVARTESRGMQMFSEGR